MHGLMHAYRLYGRGQMGQAAAGNSRAKSILAGRPTDEAVRSRKKRELVNLKAADILVRCSC